MNVLGNILSFLWRGWFVLLATICTIVIGVFIILPLCIRKKDFPKAYFFSRIWAFIIFYGIGLRLEKINFKDFSGSHPYLIIANHTSMIDIMVMLMINKKPMVFVGKQELRKLPVFGFIFSRSHILVDRKNAASRKKVLSDSVKKIKEGNAICIFPEGGVPEESVFLDKFKNGAFLLSINNKVPLVTTTICGLKKILPYAYFRGRPGKVRVYLNSVESTLNYANTDVELLKNKSREEIYNTLKSCQENNWHY